MSLEAAESELSFLQHFTFPGHFRVSVFVYALHVNDGVSLNALFQASLLLISSLFTISKIRIVLHSDLVISWYVIKFQRRRVTANHYSTTVLH
jgi:hypothetical protein